MAASLRGAVRVATSLAHRTLGLGTGDRVGVYCMIQSNRVGPGLQVGAKKADSKRAELSCRSAPPVLTRLE